MKLESFDTFDADVKTAVDKVLLKIRDISSQTAAVDEDAIDEDATDKKDLAAFRHDWITCDLKPANDDRKGEYLAAVYLLKAGRVDYQLTARVSTTSWTRRSRNSPWARATRQIERSGRPRLQPIER